MAPTAALSPVEMDTFLAANWEAQFTAGQHIVWAKETMTSRGLVRERARRNLLVGGGERDRKYLRFRRSQRAGVIDRDEAGVGRSADAIAHLPGDNAHGEVPTARGVGMEQAGIGEITSG